MKGLFRDRMVFFNWGFGVCEMVISGLMWVGIFGGFDINGSI